MLCSEGEALCNVSTWSHEVFHTSFLIGTLLRWHLLHVTQSADVGTLLTFSAHQLNFWKMDSLYLYIFARI